MTSFFREVSMGGGPRKDFVSRAPAPKVSFYSIPVSGFSAMFGTDKNEKMIVDEAVRKACTEVGFFYI